MNTNQRATDREAPGHEIEPVVFERRWLILAVLCMSLMIVIIGNTSLNVAIPTLARELDAPTSSLQWMVDSYALIFAGLLFTAGAIGDRFGRKGALQAGLLLFLVGAAIATVADSSATVIAARGVMGVAAAFVMPSTLSILTNVFPGSERPKAIAIWAGISGGGAAIGPIASGWLLEHFWWGSVFLVNVPLIAFALVAGAILVPRSRDPQHQPIDVPGAVLSIIALSSLVYGIIEGPHNGWMSPETLATFALSAIAFVAFVWRESSARFPMLDLGLFRNRRFSVASAGMTLTFFAMFGTFFLIAQYFQLVLDYTPLQSGLLQLPVAFIIMGIAPRVPKLVERFGVASVVPIGLTFTATGLALFSVLQVDSSLVNVYLAMVPLATGMAITMTPLTTMIMSAVPLGRAGVGSAMNDTTRELGGALGVAVLGSVVTSRYASGIVSSLGSLPEQSRAIADSGLAGALDVGARLGGTQGEALADAARRAFVDGLNTAALVGAAVVFAAAIATRLLLPSGRSGYTSGTDRPTNDEADAPQKRSAGRSTADSMSARPMRAARTGRRPTQKTRT